MRRYLPLAIFLSVAFAILVVAGFAFFATEEAAKIKFAATADDAVARIESRLDLHLALLKSTHALFEANEGKVSKPQFRTFFDTLDVDRDFPGLRGIGYLTLVKRGEEAAAKAALLEMQGVQREIYPESDLELRAPILLFEPLDDSNAAALGFDMYTDPPRRTAIDRALATGVAASGRVQFGQQQGGQTFPGFLVFQRVERGGLANAPAGGLLYAAFRARDLFDAALGTNRPLPINAEVFDGAPEPQNLLYQSETPASESGMRLLVTREVDVIGRKWTIRFRPTADFVEPASRAVPLTLGLAGLLIAAAIAMGARYQAKAYEVSEALQQTMEKTLTERDLMLQEMKHRIKNLIARVLAMSRQTAAGSKSIEDFSSSFSARLQAMAMSQDMLTRSTWRRADLETLLRGELEQVFGQQAQGLSISGAPVELDEAATQALGLVFHELATNALKYAESGGSNVAIDIGWSAKRSESGRRLLFKWKEGGQTGVKPPSKVGFGTKLIDVNITRELGGTIRRDYRADGLSIEIDVPLG